MLREQGNPVGFPAASPGLGRGVILTPGSTRGYCLPLLRAYEKCYRSGTDCRADLSRSLQDSKGSWRASGPFFISGCDLRFDAGFYLAVFDVDDERGRDKL